MTSHQSIQSREDLEKYQWKNRLLLVFSKNKNKINKQLKKLDEKENKERDLIIIQFNNTDSKIRKEFEVYQEDFAVLLIGKDGGVKSRSDGIQSARYFYDLIDSMPMRKQEMKREDHTK